MERPLQITFRNMDPSEAVEARIRDKVAHLEHYYDRIIGCHVVVEAPHQHSRKGNLFQITVELAVPRSAPIVAGIPHHDNHAHEDIAVAIRDAFEAARRQLLDYAQKARGDVKHHASAYT